MFHIINRTNQGKISEWWHTIDRVSLLIATTLILIGILASATASPSVALRIGSGEFFFLKKHITNALLTTFTMIGFSFLKPRQLSYLSLCIFPVCFVLLVAVPILGQEIKGAKRWLHLYKVHLQPSEVMRPWLVLVTALILHTAEQRNNRVYYILLSLLYTLVITALLTQPDVSMVLMVSMVLIIQVFVSRLHIIWIASIFIFLAVCGVVAYATFPHVRQRIAAFLASDDKTIDHYQTTKAMDAFHNGGFFGVGPGQGIAKNHIPDSHSDFIFAVIGEEFGFVGCASILLAFLVQSVRCIIKTKSQCDNFCLYAVVGLVGQIQLQALINIGVATRLLPTTGVTLPLISYGGSSMMSTGITIGIILALTKQRTVPRITFKH